MQERLLSYQEAADVLSIAKGTLAWLVHKKQIPHLRLGPRTVRFQTRELASWLESKRIDVITGDHETN